MTKRNSLGVVSEAVEVLAGGLNYFDLNRYIAGDDLYEARLSGWVQGYHFRDLEVANLEGRCDALYLQAYSPKVRAEMIKRQLDEHFAAEEARLYAEWTR